MKQHLGSVTFLVREYQEALDFFCKRLNFELIEDIDLGNGKRWVQVAPRGSGNCNLLLARATSEEQQKAVGNQAGGRVAFFLHSDDFKRDYRRMMEQGVRFLETPRHEQYGTVAVFEDLYANKWDLLELKNEI